jgi:hypothetical protein
MNLGPFDVSAAQVARLDARFSEFVKRLLAAEMAAHSLRGRALVVNSNENTADGGVDAGLRGASRTDWLPEGDSAWQFKRSDLSPKSCAEEFEKATWAHEFVAKGGAYVVALGVPRNDRLITRRREAVARKAIELGLLATDDPERICVYDAEQLARWASHFPSLAVSRLLGGPGSSAIDHESWSRSRKHQASWVADDPRRAAIQAIRDEVMSSGIIELRVQGEGGIGKTRLVMEALRDETLRPLVAYVDSERSVGGELLGHLVEEGRAAILVVDDCPAERHVKLAERLPADPGVKLITLGGEGVAATRSPVIAVAGLPEEQTDLFLRVNYTEFSAEARRFITEHTRGNTRWTILVADRLRDAEAAQAADLIRRNDIESFVTELLPEGRAFFLSAVLALVERVGWDRELRPQLEVLAQFAGATLAEFDDVGRELEQRGLLTREGRYRVVSPHPLAVFLAAEAWRTEGERIVRELLPALDRDLALALFKRAADLGQFEPARSVLPALLAPDGPFGSLRALEEGGVGQLLTQLAIVLPDEVTLHLSDLIQLATIDELRSYTNSRRDLVWTLEKLVWHRRTFESAANSLLRLSQAENETWANNATGAWADLFGTMLPGTAATPAQRVEYVRKLAASEDPATRAFAVKAAQRMLGHMQHEVITVSGELQGGVLVEPRGTPATYGEAGEYRRAGIGILDELTSDPEASVADAATSVLIEATHPLIDDPFVGDALAEVLAKQTGAALDQLRTNITSLIHLHQRHDSEDSRKVLARLESLAESLPPPSELDQFHLLLQLRPWDLEEDELLARIRESLRVLEDKGETDQALAVLDDQEVFSAWFVGRALADLMGEDEALKERLASALPQNAGALVGYLTGLVEHGKNSAFDDFLEGRIGRELDDSQRLAIAVRGPTSAKAKDRVLGSIAALPVAIGARQVFAWQRELTQPEVTELARGWAERLESQEDYNALVDWLNFRPLDQELPDSLREITFDVLYKRKAFPALGQQAWDWSQLAKALAAQRGVELARLILELVNEGKLTVLEHHEESQVLILSAQSFPKGVWNEVAILLSQRSWRIPMEIRSWFLSSIPSGIVESWIGDDVERARLVASIAPAGGDQPSPYARFLLQHFPDDDDVASGLWGNFISGTWMGPESDRLEAQIEQLNRWRTAGEPEGVRQWAAEVMRGLEARRLVALEREAEERY